MDFKPKPSLSNCTIIADVLHARNPFTEAPPEVSVRIPAPDWLTRIETLVGLHKAQLVTGGLWIGAVPDKDGRVHTYTAQPMQLT